MSRAAKRVIIALLVVVLALVGVGAWYVNDYYHADETALAAMEGGRGGAVGDTASAQTASGNITVEALSDKAVAFVPAEPRAGFIFYPGGKVAPEAYAPLMRRCAEQGILCILLKPLLNLAVLDSSAADGLQERFPDIDFWVIGGHSLGGVVASQYAAGHASDFGALVLLASYSNTDLSAFKGEVLLVTGSNDQVLNREKYDEARPNLPASARELVIEGGNHAQFGNYGEQAGDGAATITPDEQQSQTADAIATLAS